jgi:hypothetical protein
MTLPPDPVLVHRRLGLASRKQPSTQLPRTKPRKLLGSLQARLRSTNLFQKHLLQILRWVPRKGLQSIHQEGTPVLKIYIYFFITDYLVNREPLCRVPKDFNLVPSAKSVPVGSESPKVDKPPSPQTEKTTPEPLKPLSPTGAQSPVGAGGTPTTPTHMASGHDCTQLCEAEVS